MGRIGIRATALAAALLCLVGAAFAGAEPPLRTGTIIIGVPRSHFVVLGADRLWTNALTKPGDPPWDRQGRHIKIARHPSLPLAVAVAGLGTLGPQQDTVAYVGELIASLDRSALRFDAIVERLRPPLHEALRGVREPARRALATNPSDAEAGTRLKVARLTLIVAYADADQATLGWLQIEDDWKANREAAPRGAVAWPNALDGFYRTGPFAGAPALFGYSIQEPGRLAEHVRRVIEAGIREDARVNLESDRHVGGPVDVVLVDGKGARCVPSCSPP
jgi:hypothetical protein